MPLRIPFNVLNCSCVQKGIQFFPLYVRECSPWSASRQLRLGLVFLRRCGRFHEPEAELSHGLEGFAAESACQREARQDVLHLVLTERLWLRSSLLCCVCVGSIALQPNYTSQKQIFITSCILSFILGPNKLINYHRSLEKPFYRNSRNPGCVIVNNVTNRCYCNHFGFWTRMLSKSYVFYLFLR